MRILEKRADASGLRPITEKELEIANGGAGECGPNPNQGGGQGGRSIMERLWKGFVGR